MSILELNLIWKNMALIKKALYVKQKAQHMEVSYNQIIMGQVV